MKRKRKAPPIEVEAIIETSMEDLWSHTQTPDLHARWDLRFSSIHYLPKVPGEREQRFHYRTRIGFGLAIDGTGVTCEKRNKPNGSRMTALVFASGHPLSLIAEGSGYWLYEPIQGAGGQDTGSLRFYTQYNYHTRFGGVGRIVDRFLFRPLFAWATAWSFDALRIWLERGITPEDSLRKARIHAVSVLILALCWSFEGAVPKLMGPSEDELMLLRATGLATGWETLALQALGLLELLLSVLLVVRHKDTRLYLLQEAMLLILAATAGIANPAGLMEPFNPIVMTIPLIGASWFARWTAQELPRASQSLKRIGFRSHRGGE